MPLSLFAPLDRRLTPAPDPDRVSWIGGQAYAHRGLHGPGVPENSPAAFAAAIERGMGIELDVQRSSDGQAMVFHDWELDRLTGETGPLEQLTAAQLSAIRLTGGEDTIPTLRQVLDQIGGRVPLLIEVKSRRDMRVPSVCLAVLRVQEGYRGPHAVMSFDPRVPKWFKRYAPLTVRGLVITEVLSLGPADLTGQIKPGDVLSAVNGKPVGAGVNLAERLLDQAGKRTVLKVATGGAAPREVTVKPISSGVAGGLRYREWVEGRRAYVEKISNGRLGYVHLIDMSSDALAQLYLDLDSQNQGREGVVVDIRNNNGGFVNGYVLDVFARKNFLMMTPRDFYAIPSRQALGQRALGLPTVLVTNESSLSDAEDFTEGYRALGLGKVVGQPTAGWIIFTSGQALIDGSVVRLPSTRIQDAKGGDMEMHPRPVDIRVERPLGDTAAGKDAQLDAAAAELLKTLGPVRK